MCDNARRWRLKSFQNLRENIQEHFFAFYAFDAVLIIVGNFIFARFWQDAVIRIMIHFRLPIVATSGRAAGAAPIQPNGLFGAQKEFFPGLNSSKRFVIDL